MPHLPQTVLNAARVRTAPVSPLFQTPLERMARAVRVQMMIVSMNTSMIPYIP